MRKYLALLLALLTCTLGAAAEEMLTEGAFVYTIWEDPAWGDGGAAEVVDFRLEEGQSELFVPPTLGGHLVVSVDADKLPASVHTVCVSDWVGSVVPPEGRELVEYFYVDENDMQASYGDRMRDLGIVVNEGEYLLTNASCMKMVGGEMLVEEVPITRETLPREIGGQRVVADMLCPPVVEQTAEETVYTHGELLYTRDEAQQTAIIVGYDLAEGQTELFIPTAIEGHTVVDFEYELVPLQIEKLWVNANTGKMIWNFGDKPKNHERLTYNYTQATEDSITLENVVLDTWNGDGQMANEPQFTNVNTVPDTIAGKQVQFAQNGWFCYSEGIWDYALNQDENGNAYLLIVGCTVPEGTKEVIVPPEIGGYKADVPLDLDVLPESVEKVYMLGDASSYSIVSNEKRNRIVTQIKYINWENATRGNGVIRPAEMQKDELMWAGVTAYDFGKQEFLDRPYNVVIDAELPAELNG